jgi:hypothetical protein
MRLRGFCATYSGTFHCPFYLLLVFTRCYWGSGEFGDRRAKGVERSDFPSDMGVIQGRRTAPIDPPILCLARLRNLESSRILFLRSAWPFSRLFPFPNARWEFPIPHRRLRERLLRASGIPPRNVRLQGPCP